MMFQVVYVGDPRCGPLSQKEEEEIMEELLKIHNEIPILVLPYTARVESLGQGKYILRCGDSRTGTTSSQNQVDHWLSLLEGVGVSRDCVAVLPYYTSQIETILDESVQ